MVSDLYSGDQFHQHLCFCQAERWPDTSGELDHEDLLAEVGETDLFEDHQIVFSAVLYGLGEGCHSAEIVLETLDVERHLVSFGLFMAYFMASNLAW